MKNTIPNQAQCNKCRKKLGDYENYALHTIDNRTPVRIGDILLCDNCATELFKCKRCNQDSAPVVLKSLGFCEECATELLQDAQSAREEDE